MNEKQAGYRNKKNRQLWATIRQYGDVIAAHGGDREQAEDLVRAHARRRFGAEHLSALSGAQLLLLVEDVEAMMTGHAAPAVEARGANSATPQQLATIRGMYAALDWNASRQAAYNRRIIQADAPTTRRDASKLIRAIQAMFLHQLDLDRLREQIAACRAAWNALDTYKRRVVADAEAKLAEGKSALTMGLVCKVMEAAEAARNRR